MAFGDVTSPLEAAVGHRCRDSDDFSYRDRTRLLRAGDGEGRRELASQRRNPANNQKEISIDIKAKDGRFFLNFFFILFNVYIYNLSVMTDLQT